MQPVYLDPAELIRDNIISVRTFNPFDLTPRKTRKSNALDIVKKQEICGSLLLA
jgi:hypothetical protein